MGRKKSLRLCSNCGYRHGTPTGKNCVLAGQRSVDFDKDLPADSARKELPAGAGAPAGRSRSDSSSSSDRDSSHRLDIMKKDFDSRLDKLESLFLKSLDHRRNASPSDTSGRDSSSDSSSSLAAHRHRRRRKHKESFDQSKFLEEGEDLRTFECLMLMSSRHLVYLLEHGVDPTHLVHHIRFMATKATLGHYKLEAFISYDAVVRRRVAKEGMSAFSDVLQEDVVLHFSPENMIPKVIKQAKKGDQAKKKSSGYCKAFNDGDCAFAKCIFTHRCMACDEASHSRKQCPNIKKSR